MSNTRVDKGEMIDKMTVSSESYSQSMVRSSISCVAEVGRVQKEKNEESGRERSII